MRNDRVLVRRITQPTSTQGGIILPDRAQQLPQLGFVIAIGPKNPEEIMPGDMVIVKKFEGSRWEPDPINKPEEVYWLFRRDDILAVVERPR